MTIIREPYRIRCRYCKTYLSFGEEDIIPGYKQEHSIPHVKCAQCHKCLPIPTRDYEKSTSWELFMMTSKEIEHWQE